MDNSFLAGAKNVWTLGWRPRSGAEFDPTTVSANSGWVEIIASTPSDVDLVRIEGYYLRPITAGLIELAIGPAGSEEPLGDFPLFSVYDSDNLYLPIEENIPGAIPAGSRISVRQNNQNGGSFFVVVGGYRLELSQTTPNGKVLSIGPNSLAGVNGGFLTTSGSASGGWTELTSALTTDLSGFWFYTSSYQTGKISLGIGPAGAEVEIVSESSGIWGGTRRGPFISYSIPAGTRLAVFTTPNFGGDAHMSLVGLKA